MVLRIFRMIMILSLALLLGWAIGIGETNTWTICGQGCDFTSIQAAIEAAAPGDTVIVNPETAIVFGQYMENIVIDKPVILEGQGDSPFIMAKDSSQPVILVESQVKGVIIRGFEISRGAAGISIEDDAQVIIQANSIDGNGVGIAIGAAQASIQDNFIYENGKTGIGGGGISIGWAEGGKEGIIEIIHNAISENGGPGGGVGIEAFMPGELSSLVILDNSISRTIRGNGIWVATKGRVEIRGNAIAGSKEGNGVTVITAKKVSIKNNIITGNEWDGLAIWGKESNIINNIIVSNEKAGVALGDVPSTGMEVAIGKFSIVRNQVRLNGGGIIIGSVDDCFAGKVSGKTYSMLEIRGSDNTIERNYQGDLCPEDYPWPEGFLREEG